MSLVTAVMSLTGRVASLVDSAVASSRGRVMSLVTAVARA